MKIIGPTYYWLAATTIACALLAGCSSLPPFVPVPSTWSGGSEHGALINNVPVVIFDGPNTWQYRIALENYQGVTALEFPVAMDDGSFVWSNEAAAMKQCWGTLYVTRDYTTFMPTISNKCGTEPIAQRQVKFHSKFGFRSDPDEPNMFDIFFADNDNLGAPLYIRSDNGQYLLSDQDLTGGRFAFWLKLAITNFDLAASRFMELTANIELPLTVQQQDAVQAKETSGDVAASRQDYGVAVSDYIAAMQILPVQYAPRDVETRLRTKIIDTVLRLNSPPVLPDNAVHNEHFAKDAAEAAHLYSTIAYFQKAVHYAPWWADGYYNLAVAMEKAKIYGMAADALQWYLRAAPNAPDAAQVKLRIDNLQYKATQQESDSQLQ